MQRTQTAELFTKVIEEVYKFTGLMSSNGEKVSQQYGLSSAKWKIIRVLAGDSQTLTVTNIAQEIGQTRQAVQRIVNAMCKEHLTRFETNPKHKRAKLVLLTEQGKKVQQQLEEKQIPWANHVSEQLDPNNLEITLQTINELYQLLDYQLPSK